MKELLLKIERTKASIRAKVEHPFHVLKHFFGYWKARDTGLAKTQAQLFSLFWPIWCWRRDAKDALTGSVRLEFLLLSAWS